MPMYEYRCAQCGETLETIQKFSDEPLKIHESCGGALERLLSAPALQFKGSGWYITDYARGGDSKGKNSSDEKNSGGETAGKTESKPAGDSSSAAPAAAGDSAKK